MAATPHDSLGTTFSFGGTAYTVSSITYTLTDPNATDTIDISHLGQTTGEAVLSQDRPLTGAADDTGVEVQIEYIGSNAIVGGTTGTLVITGGLSISRDATASQCTISLTTNDVIRGNATFRVAAS